MNDEQKKAINEALTTLEKAMESLNINLTPDDCNKYGRVNEQNKLFINKTWDYAQSQPSLRTSDVDWEEVEKDFKSRNFLENTISRLNNLANRCVNSKTFHDFDNYQDSLSDYVYTQFKEKVRRWDLKKHTMPKSSFSSVREREHSQRKTKITFRQTNKTTQKTFLINQKTSKVFCWVINS